MGIAACLNREPGRRRCCQIARHHDGRAAIKGERRDDHAPVPDRDKILFSCYILLPAAVRAGSGGRPEGANPAWDERGTSSRRPLPSSMRSAIGRSRPVRTFFKCGMYACARQFLIVISNALKSPTTLLPYRYPFKFRLVLTNDHIRSGRPTGGAIGAIAIDLGTSRHSDRKRPGLANDHVRRGSARLAVSRPCHAWLSDPASAAGRRFPDLARTAIPSWRARTRRSARCIGKKMPMMPRIGRPF